MTSAEAVVELTVTKKTAKNMMSDKNLMGQCSKALRDIIFWFKYVINPPRHFWSKKE
jgi:hypothetical protein